MPRIVVINMGAHGHVNPTLPVVAELVRGGAAVTYFTTAEFEGAVRETGASFAPVDSQLTKTTPAAGLPPQEMFQQFPARLIDEALHVTPQLEPLVRAARPDLILYDRMAMAGKLLARRLEVPAALFSPSYVANEHFSLAGRFGAGDPQHPASERFRRGAAELAQRYGGQPLEVADLFRHAEGLNIVFLPRAFQYSGETFDERFVFVGPALAPRPSAGRWEPRAAGRPLLFISLGTVFNAWPEFFQMCFEAFAGGPRDVLMAVGRRVDPAGLGPVPANITVAPHVPQLDVLPHAQVFVTHGGMNSTQEALYFGVPLVVIPQMPEQAATARRVVELGLGAALTRESASAESLRSAVDAVAGDVATRQRVAHMQQEVRAAGGQVRAAAAIRGYLSAATRG